ncbi:MAG: hypothetical protein SH808_12565 [Saprospiraceae bacterium]|nr:hypothetical protein [Saprospiraceae bacterium]
MIQSIRLFILILFTLPLSSKGQAKYDSLKQALFIDDSGSVSFIISKQQRNDNSEEDKNSLWFFFKSKIMELNVEKETKESSLFIAKLAE